MTQEEFIEELRRLPEAYVRYMQCRYIPQLWNNNRPYHPICAVAEARGLISVENGQELKNSDYQLAGQLLGMEPQTIRAIHQACHFLFDEGETDKLRLRTEILGAIGAVEVRN